MEIVESMKAMIPMEEDLRQKLREISDSRNIQRLNDFLKEIADGAYAQREKQVGEEAMRNLERMLFLRVVDELWVDHLEQMEYLRDSVRLRAYGQRDPLVEYKIEGQKMFNQLQAAINSQVANLIFKVSFIHPHTKQESAIESRDESYSRSGVGAQMQQEATRQEPATNSSKVGRNDPCPCGAKKPDGRPVKYKHCHGKNV